MSNSLPDNPIFSKPNQLISVIEKSRVNRLAWHLGNYFLRHAQQEVKKEENTDSENKNENENENENKWRMFVLPVRELNEKAGIASKSYNEIVSSLSTLNTTLVITDFNPSDLDKNRKPKKETITIVQLISMIEIEIDTESNTGVYKFWLSNKVINLLRQNDYYTNLHLVEFNELESKHSIKIYEWLKRYETNPSGIPLMTIEKLRQITQTDDKPSYDNFTNIQTKILNIAVREICEKTPYQVSYEPIKERTGRRPKVTKLRWTFERKAEPEQKSVSNTTQSKSTDIHSKYAELATLYVSKGFCESEADFYRATYICDYGVPNEKGEYRGGLKGFYDAKKHMTQAKNKLAKYLLADIEKGTKNGRWPRQIEVYQALLARLSAKDQAFMIEKQATQGFYEQILILKKHLGDVTPVKDPENWL